MYGVGGLESGLHDLGLSALGLPALVEGRAERAGRKRGVRLFVGYPGYTSAL